MMYSSLIMHDASFRTYFKSFPDYSKFRAPRMRQFKLSQNAYKPEKLDSFNYAEAGQIKLTSSLIPETLRGMEGMGNTEINNITKLEETIIRDREERIKRQRSLNSLNNLPSFTKLLKTHNVTEMTRSPVKIFQLNIGLYCNQACSHCHVESSPKRTEMIDKRTADRCIELMRRSNSIKTIDITGGAPELNAHFRYIVEASSQLGFEIIDRCNLTVLLEPGQEDLVEFLARHKVRIVASLPCYSQKNVDQQRGTGIFDRSIKALKMLNEIGYGKEDSHLKLDLVYNPNGDFLPPPQHTLEEAYKKELKDHYDIVFNNLFCITNMPIKRFADFLYRKGKLESYMKLLIDNFNPAAAENIMCRNTISVNWNGHIYDCDFNQQLNISCIHPNPNPSEKKNTTVFDIDSLDDLTGWQIACDSHCFGCTAGSGSSCQGETSFNNQL